MRLAIGVLAFAFVASFDLSAAAKSRHHHPSQRPHPSHLTHSERSVVSTRPGFDYYVLAMTWVPGFCSTKSDPNECGKDLGFGLHGLWPQYESRGYPQNCSTVALAPAVRQQYKNIYPSPTMIDHEWTKHGTCSGLTPVDYFEKSAAYMKHVVIPQQYLHSTDIHPNDVEAVRTAFVNANPGLSKADVTTSIDRGHDVLMEVRICLAKEGVYRSCGPQ